MKERTKVNFTAIDIHGTEWTAENVTVRLLDREGIIKVYGDTWIKNFIIANLVCYSTTFYSSKDPALDGQMKIEEDDN